MDILLLEPPHGFEKIVQILKNKKWLMSAFEANEEEFFNPANYIYNNDYANISYKLILDLNIFSFIISAIKQEVPKEIHRSALALVAFCQICNIHIEPNLAVYEKIFSEKWEADEAVNKLLLFYKIDNADTESIIKYSLSNNDSIELYGKTKHKHSTIKKELTKNKWLTEWKSMYLITLNIVLANTRNGSNLEKFEAFANWMLNEFRFSFVATVYAIYLFSSLRMKKMLKYKPESPRVEQISQLNNMTWDLFFMNSFFRGVTDDNNSYEIIVASDDKVIKEVLSTGISIQKQQGDFNILKNKLRPKEHIMIEIIDEIFSQTNLPNRVYGSAKWTTEYREDLITKTESIILNPS